ncbi:MAG: PAS domain-containing protein, partial [Euryarchaeota archaeon]|nr:PAS domain-containing protein [Euryarchaeota archaeon]
MLLAGVGLVLVTVIGVVLVFYFVDDQRDRDLRAWQVRMGIVADSRFAAVNGWVDRQFAHMRELAENASLQLYLTELALFAGDASQVTDEPAQRTYLRNLLMASAERSGFTAPLLGAEINANVERIGVAGIAIVDNDAKVIVATPGMPPVVGDLAAIILANRGQRALYDLHIGAGGRATMGFLSPIFALQSDGSPSDQIGMAVGVKEVGGELYPLLEQPGAVNTSAEAVILRDAGVRIDYLSPLMDGGAPLSRALARDTPELAAAFAIEKPGGFAIRRDYQNVEVLTLGRAFTTAPWTLMYKIDAAEALADTDSRLGRMLTVFLLIIAAIAVSLIAAWRHGTSLRSSRAAAEASELAKKFGQQRDFLELVTDSQSNAMAIIDGDGRYIWVNRQSAENNGTTAADVPGKTLAAVVGPAPAKALLQTVRDALRSGASEQITHIKNVDGDMRTYTSQFIPLSATDDLPERVLVVSEDVTAAVSEQAKRERIMSQLVNTLVGV